MARQKHEWLWLRNNEAIEKINQIAKRDGVYNTQVLEQCALIGADFLLSSIAGDLLEEYYNQTGSFNWERFIKCVSNNE